MQSCRLVLIAFLAARLCPQTTPTTQKQPIVSTDLKSDGRVTFRITAASATEVTLGGDWIDAPQTINLTKNPEGVWSAVIGPLAPDYYLYWFTVDGVPTVDPLNPYVLQRVVTVQNILHIPGAGIEFAEETAVPHGEIREVRYSSGTYGRERRMHVYTPPGYDGGTDLYSVLYLLHGGGDDDSSWSSIGRAGFILDNLISTGRAKPLIVVMPDLNKPRLEGVRPMSGTVAERSQFEGELFREVVPFVERTYRVAAGPRNRAVAGLSVGGYATLNLLARHTDEFAYFGVWSAPVENKTVSEAEVLYAPILEHPEKINDTGKVVWLCVGEKDGGATAVKAMAEIFRKHSLHFELRLSGGAHRWTVWRRNLYDFAQVLFRSQANAAGR